MPESRRKFLALTAGGLAGIAGIAVAPAAADTLASLPEPPPTPPGTPPAFGTAPAVGPEISVQTVAEAEKLVRVELTGPERSQLAGNWREAMAGLMERRTGPRKVALEPALAPAMRWDPMLPGIPPGPARDRFERSRGAPGRLPERDDEIAFAPVTALSRWIESRALTSERLTRIYLDRIARLDGRLRCVITLTSDLALE